MKITSITSSKPRAYSDIYRGFDIRYHPDDSHYRVFKGNTELASLNSYDAACDWIDHAIRNGINAD